MSYNAIIAETDKHGILRLTLNRPESRNSMSTELAMEMIDVFDKVDADESIRGIVLTGAGEAFCAGGDLKWMQEIITQTRKERIAGSSAVAGLLYRMYDVTKPIIGRINGDGFGGGTGLTALCDVAVGARGKTRLCVSETMVGLAPANIAPFLVRKMGEGRARSVMLNARIMDADTAVHYGLLSYAVDPDDFDAAIEEEVGNLLRCAPQGVVATKALISYVARHSVHECWNYTVDRLADAWETEDGQEGVAAFVEKRKPRWNPVS